jgi:hypothetical protein
MLTRFGTSTMIYYFNSVEKGMHAPFMFNAVKESCRILALHKQKIIHLYDLLMEVVAAPEFSA